MSAGWQRKRKSINFIPGHMIYRESVSLVVIVVIWMEYKESHKRKLQWCTWLNVWIRYRIFQSLLFLLANFFLFILMYKISFLSQVNGNSGLGSVLFILGFHIQWTTNRNVKIAKSLAFLKKIYVRKLTWQIDIVLWGWYILLR